jgi:hypothetical protein
MSLVEGEGGKAPQTLAEIAQLFVDWDTIVSTEFDDKYPGLLERLKSDRPYYQTVSDAFNGYCRDLFKAALSHPASQSPETSKENGGANV